MIYAERNQISHSNLSHQNHPEDQGNQIVNQHATEDKKLPSTW